MNTIRMMLNAKGWIFLLIAFYLNWNLYKFKVDAIEGYEESISPGLQLASVRCEGVWTVDVKGAKLP